MALQHIFTIANLLAITGWFALAINYWFRRSDRYVIGVVVALLATLYSWLVFSGFRISDFNAFSSLQGVREMFSNEKVLLAGWVHYLAFDLMAGYFIVTNARKHKIPHWAALLCALGAFMLGPLGLLAFLLLRAFYTHNWFAEN